MRTQKGGAMGPTADAAGEELRKYIIGRHGYEMRQRWEPAKATQRTTLKNDPDWRRALGKLHVRVVSALVRIVGGSGMATAFQAGLFRTSGELHLHMYDRFSLGRLISALGIKDIKVCSAWESRIPDFAGYELDSIGPEVRKPDSLFIEGVKG